MQRIVEGTIGPNSDHLIKEPETFRLAVPESLTSTSHDLSLAPRRSRHAIRKHKLHARNVPDPEVTTKSAETHGIPIGPWITC
jgi:hypothetical protein